MSWIGTTRLRWCRGSDTTPIRRYPCSMRHPPRGFRVFRHLVFASGSDARVHTGFRGGRNAAVGRGAVGLRRGGDPPHRRQSRNVRTLSGSSQRLNAFASERRRVSSAGKCRKITSVIVVFSTQAIPTGV